MDNGVRNKPPTRENPGLGTHAPVSKGSTEQAESVLSRIVGRTDGSREPLTGRPTADSRVKPKDLNFDNPIIGFCKVWTTRIFFQRFRDRYFSLFLALAFRVRLRADELQETSMPRGRQAK